MAPRKPFWLRSHVAAAKRWDRREANRVRAAKRYQQTPTGHLEEHPTLGLPRHQPDP